MLKKRLGLILLAVVTIASTTACTRVATTIPDNSQTSVETTSPSKVPTNSKPSVETTSPSKVPDSSKPSVDINSEVSSNAVIEPYFGTWIIKKFLPTGGVVGFSKKNANDYLGEKFVVDKNQIVTEEGTIIGPQFVKITLTNNQFFDKFNFSLKNVGIAGSSVTQISVSNFSIKNGTEDRIGSNFILSNDNKTYTFIGGALFELSK